MKKIALYHHWPAVLLPIICLGTQLLWPVGDGPLVFYKGSTLANQPFALIGSSLLHTNWNHLLMNLAAYGLIYCYSVQSLLGWRMPLLTLLCGTAATWGFAISPTPLSSLVGLSGALHGCLVYLAISEWKLAPRLMSMTLIAVAGKLVWEQWIGPSEHTVALIGASVATWSHLSGAIAGVLFGLLNMQRMRRTEERQA